jgi:RNA polymerase sigma factor (sigma-70 family)
MQTSLVEDHIVLVDKLARRFHRRLPRHIDVEDIASIGYIELVKLAKRYDPANERKASFATFAGHRIWGAFQDYVRSEVGRDGQYIRQSCWQSLDYQDSSPRPFTDMAESMDSALAEREWAGETCQTLLPLLTERESQVARLLMCDYTQREISDYLNITESRVSQLVRSMRAKIEDSQE